MLSLRQIHKQYKTQPQCMELLISLRWPEGVRCPRCDNDKVFKVKHRAWNWTCKSGKASTTPDGKPVICDKKNGYRFSPLVGTVFENTNYPLPVWFEVIYLMTKSKKGISALQIQAMLKENNRPTAYKTAFYICHRVRAMLQDDGFPRLMGVVVSRPMRLISAVRIATGTGIRKAHSFAKSLDHNLSGKVSATARSESSAQLSVKATLSAR